MTLFVASVSCNILGISSDKYHQMPIPLKNCQIGPHKHEILAVVHVNILLQTSTEHSPNWPKIAQWLDTPASCSSTRQDLSSVELACWLLFFPFWLAAYYIILRTSHSSSLSSSSPISQQQNISPQPPQPCESASESSQTIEVSWNTTHNGTQQQHNDQLVHCNAANAATANMALDTHLEWVLMIRSSKNLKQHAVGCEYIHIEIDRHQLYV